LGYLIECVFEMLRRPHIFNRSYHCFTFVCEVLFEGLGELFLPLSLLQHLVCFGLFLPALVQQIFVLSQTSLQLLCLVVVSALGLLCLNPGLRSLFDFHRNNLLHRILYRLLV